MTPLKEWLHTTHISKLQPSIICMLQLYTVSMATSMESKNDVIFVHVSPCTHRGDFSWALPCIERLLWGVEVDFEPGGTSATAGRSPPRRCCTWRCRRCTGTRRANLSCIYRPIIRWKLFEMNQLSRCTMSRCTMSRCIIPHRTDLNPHLEITCLVLQWKTILKRAIFVEKHFLSIFRYTNHLRFFNLLVHNNYFNKKWKYEIP